MHWLSGGPRSGSCAATVVAQNRFISTSTPHARAARGSARHDEHAAQGATYPSTPRIGRCDAVRANEPTRVPARTPGTPPAS